MSAPPWDYIAKLVCIGDSGCGKSSLTVRLCEGRFVPHHDVTIGVEFGSRIVPVGPPHSKTLPPFGSAKSASTPLSPSTAAATSATIANGTSRNGGTSTRPSTSSSFSPTGLPEPPRAAPPDGPQKHMKLSVWDTAGQETYKSVTRSYFRGASGALLVFDLSRRSTFLNVTTWLEDLKVAEPNIVVVLVGNKADLARGEEEEEHAAGLKGTNGYAAATTPSPLSSTPRKATTANGSTGGGGGGKDAVPVNKREVTRAEAEKWAASNKEVLAYVETSAKSGENVEMAFMRVAERIFQNIQAGKYDLNDRRSGVKGPNAGGAGGARQLQLSTAAPKASGWGCC